jgi:hypothetical protein
MTAGRRLIPNSPGHGFGLVSGRERVGNEAVVSTWNPAGDGLVTKQLVFGVTRSEFGGTAGRVMKPYDPPPRIASRRSRRSNRWALERSRSNKLLLPTGLGPTTSTPDLLNRPAAE